MKRIKTFIKDNILLIAATVLSLLIYYYLDSQQYLFFSLLKPFANLSFVLWFLNLAEEYKTFNDKNNK